MILRAFLAFVLLPHPSYSRHCQVIFQCCQCLDWVEYAPFHHFFREKTCIPRKASVCNFLAAFVFWDHEFFYFFWCGISHYCFARSTSPSLPLILRPPKPLPLCALAAFVLLLSNSASTGVSDSVPDCPDCSYSSVESMF